MVCGRKRPLGIEKSDDHGRHKSTDCLWVTKSSPNCVAVSAAHTLQMQAALMTACISKGCICINTVLFVLHIFNVFKSKYGCGMLVSCSSCWVFYSCTVTDDRGAQM